MSRVIYFLILVFTFTCFSCAQIEKLHDKILVKNTVISYNRLLIEAARTGNIEPLKEILVQREREKLNHWIASWHDSNIYMHGRLENITFKNINVSESVANVITLEDWIYEYKNLETQQSALPASAIHYEMEYILQKINGDNKKWVIKEIKIKAEKKRENKHNK